MKRHGSLLSFHRKRSLNNGFNNIYSYAEYIVYREAYYNTVTKLVVATDGIRGTTSRRSCLVCRNLLVSLEREDRP
jgi:hypothetical protein